MFIVRWLRRMVSREPPSLMDLNDAELANRLSGIMRARDWRKVTVVDFQQDASLRTDSAYTVQIVQADAFPVDKRIVLYFPGAARDRDRILRVDHRTSVHQLQPEIKRRIQASGGAGSKLVIYQEHLDRVYACAGCSAEVDIRWAKTFGTALGSAQAFTYYEEGCLMVQELDGRSSVLRTFLLQPPGQVISSDTYMMVPKPVVYRPVGHRFTSQARAEEPPMRHPAVMTLADAQEGVRSMTRTGRPKMARQPRGVIESSSDADDDAIQPYRGLMDTQDREEGEEESSSGDEEEEEEEEDDCGLDPARAAVHPYTGHQMIPMVKMNGKGDVIAYDTRTQAMLQDAGQTLIAPPPPPAGGITVAATQSTEDVFASSGSSSER